MKTCRGEFLVGWHTDLPENPFLLLLCYSLVIGPHEWKELSLYKHLRGVKTVLGKKSGQGSVTHNKFICLHLQDFCLHFFMFRILFSEQGNRIRATSSVKRSSRVNKSTPSKINPGMTIYLPGSKRVIQATSTSLLCEGQFYFQFPSVKTGQED